MTHPLILIDLQRAIDHPDWGVRNNPDAEFRLSELLAAWRARHWPVIHIRQDSIHATSHYRPGQSGHDFKPEVMPQADEIIIPKQANSAFIAPELGKLLSKLEAKTLYIAGVKTNNSVEATARHGGNLGYDIHLIEDACFTHDQRDWSGRDWPAQAVHDLTLSTLDGEYCQITTTAEVLASLPQL